LYTVCELNPNTNSAPYAVNYILLARPLAAPSESNEVKHFFLVSYIFILVRTFNKHPKESGQIEVMEQNECDAWDLLSILGCLLSTDLVNGNENNEISEY